MTNAEKFKTVEERAKAFIAFCDAHECHECRVVTHCYENYGIEAAFAWLNLEAEDEMPLPCPFCGGERMVVKKGSYNLYSVQCEDCGYTSTNSLHKHRAIAAHNRVAKAVKESEAKHETN